MWGARPLGANLDHVKALPGVRDAFILDRTVPAGQLTGLVPGVAIVADSTWSAFSARKELQVKWEDGRFAHSSWDDFGQAGPRARGCGRRARPGRRPRPAGTANLDQRSRGPRGSWRPPYSYPFISHTNLEPQNCLVHVQGDHAEVWAPTQNPDGARKLVSQVLGVPPENVQVNITRIGGGFGRRLDSDPVAEAAAISQRLGVPVKLTWNRTDDLQHDHYRPGGLSFPEGRRRRAGGAQRLAQPPRLLRLDPGGRRLPRALCPQLPTLHSNLENGVPQGPVAGAGKQHVRVGDLLLPRRARPRRGEGPG